MGFSSVVVCGNVGVDPELKHTREGKGWCRTRVAVTEWNGQKEETHWITVVLFGKRAESFARRAQKGSAVTIQGRLAEEKSDKPEYNGRLSVIGEAFEITRNWRTGDADEGRDSGREDDNPRVGLEGDAPQGDTRKGRGRSR